MGVYLTASTMRSREGRVSWEVQRVAELPPGPGEQLLRVPSTDHSTYLGKANKPKLLGQQREVDEVDLCPDSFIDGAVAKVYLRGADFQV